MRTLRHIRPCLTDDVAKIIASAVLVEVSDKNITKHQRTQNTQALIVIRKYKRRGSQSLRYLHWLPIKWLTDYKIAVTTYKLNTTGQL